MLILIMFFLIMNILAFFIFKFNLLNPINVYSIGFLISVISLYFAKNIWNVSLYSQTVSLIIIGSIAYFFGVLIVNIKLFIKKNNNTNKSLAISYSIKSNVTIVAGVITALQVITTLMLYRTLKSFAPGGSLSSMISYFRNTSMSNDSDMVSLPFTLNQLINFNMAGSFVLVFVFLYGRILLNKKVSQLAIVPIFFYMLQSILMGGRQQLLRVIIFVIGSSYFLYMYKYKSPTVSNRWVLSKSKWLLLFLPFFYLLKFFIGRTSTDNFFQYLIRYLGGPIESLDIYLRGGVLGEHLPGQETFTSLYKVINNSPVTFRWAQSTTGVWVGNVFTGIRRYYSDFGTIGVIVILLCLGLIFGVSYYFVLNRNDFKCPRSSFALIFYSFYLYSIFFEFFDDTFMSVVVSMGGILKILELYLFYKIMMKRVVVKE